MKKINKELVTCGNIKEIIINLIDSDKLMTMTFSVYLSDKLCKKYSYLSKIFVKEYHISIKEYTNNVKISRIKKLIDEDILNISEIGYKMHYSSPSHLSHQFKVITHMTPLEYKHKDVIIIVNSF